MSVTGRKFTLTRQRLDAAPPPPSLPSSHPPSLNPAAPSTALISSSADGSAPLASISQIWLTCFHMRSDFRPRAQSRQPAAAQLRHHSLWPQDSFYSLALFLPAFSFWWLVMQQCCCTRTKHESVLSFGHQWTGDVSKPCPVPSHVQLQSIIIFHR